MEGWFVPPSSNVTAHHRRHHFDVVAIITQHSHAVRILHCGFDQRFRPDRWRTVVVVFLIPSFSRHRTGIPAAFTSLPLVWYLHILWRWQYRLCL